MRIVSSHWHNRVREDQHAKALQELCEATLDDESLVLEARATRAVREEIRRRLLDRGWSDEARIASGTELTVFSRKGPLSFQIQLGNISRAAYDLLKLQYLFSARLSACGAYVLPMKERAIELGSNIACYERVKNELDLFSSIINIPLLVIGIE